MKVGLAKVEQWNLGLSASAVATSLALATPHFATSLAAGALLEALNLGALRRAAQRFFAGELSRSWTFVFAVRFVVLAIGIFLTLQAGAHPVALLLGLSIAMPAVLIDAWLNRPTILDPATLPVLLDDPSEEGDEDERLVAREEHPALLAWLFPSQVLPTRPLSPEASDLSDVDISEASDVSEASERSDATEDRR